MRILYLASSPNDGAYLDIRREINYIQNTISRFSHAVVDLSIHPAANSINFERILRDGYADIIHIACHSENGRLRFDNGRGYRADINSDQILHVLNGLQQAPKLIVFSACDSHSIAKELVGYGCPILSFDDSVSDSDSILATSALYESILTGESIKNSFLSARYVFESSKETQSRFILTSNENSGVNNILYTPPSMYCKPEGKKSKKSIDDFIEQDEVEISIHLKNLPPATHHILIYTTDREQAMEDIFYTEDSECSLEEWRAMMTSLVLYPAPNQRNISAETNWICSPEDNINCIISSRDRAIYTISEKASNLLRKP